MPVVIDFCASVVEFRSLGVEFLLLRVEFWQMGFNLCLSEYILNLRQSIFDL